MARRAVARGVWRPLGWRSDFRRAERDWRHQPGLRFGRNCQRRASSGNGWPSGYYGGRSRDHWRKARRDHGGQCADGADLLLFLQHSGPNLRFVHQQQFPSMRVGLRRRNQRAVAALPNGASRRPRLCGEGAVPARGELSGYASHSAVGLPSFLGALGALSLAVKRSPRELLVSNTG